MENRDSGTARFVRLNEGPWSRGRGLAGFPLRAEILDRWPGQEYSGTTPPHWFPTGHEVVTLRLDDGTQVRMTAEALARCTHG